MTTEKTIFYSLEFVDFFPPASKPSMRKGTFHVLSQPSRMQNITPQYIVVVAKKISRLLCA